MKLVCADVWVRSRLFAGDRGVAVLSGTGGAYGSTVVGSCEAIKASTAKRRVLWLGASGQNSKDGMESGASAALNPLKRSVER
jgi:hypothetical protein